MTDRAPAEEPLLREDFAHVERVTTRWADNDVFGHLNNAVYYELADSAINRWFIAGTGIDETSEPVIGVVAESSCCYLRELSYPGEVDVAVRVERVGRSSVVLGFAVYAADSPEPAAVGRWVQVSIDVGTRRSVPIPDPVRAFYLAGLTS